MAVLETIAFNGSHTIGKLDGFYTDRDV